MALWGTKDKVYSDGTITVNLSTKKVERVGTSATFNTAGIATGDIISVGSGVTFGYAAILSVDGAGTLSIASTEGFQGISTVTPTTYNISEEPIYVLGDKTYAAPEVKTSGFSTSSLFTGVFGVDETEQSVANAASGDKRKYAAPHAGWVGLTTYRDMHGNFRVKSETLVASSSITTDADDDEIFADS